MIEIRNILCPVDFSDFSRHALAQAAVIARWYGATLTVFHVYPTGPPPVLFGGYPGPIPLEPVSGLPRETREAIVCELQRFTDSVKIADLQMRFEARQGGAVPAILDEAKSLPADLIVLGTHGRGGVDRLVLGSVTEKVLRKATCPVLTVPPSVSEPAATAPLLFARILCAVDFSEPSMKALSYALSIAQEADAQLLVLHVLEGLHTEELTAYPDFDLSRFIQRMETDALARLRSAIADEARIWCKPVELLETGKVYREILRVARERDVHLIVLGVHGRNPVDLMLLGSTTHHVVRAASCPVLTLRA
jgi:nucleotide-binding universal stress UspA family protein